MKSVVRIRDKGQVTLPLDVRRQLGLHQGDLLQASVEDGRIVLELVMHHRARPVSVSASQLDSLVGLVNLGGDAVADAEKYAE